MKREMKESKTGYGGQGAGSTELLTQVGTTKPLRDPWVHRNISMRCKTCMWYIIKAKSIGRCRRHAPTMNGYPVVFEFDWCGDHKLDENAS